MGTVCWDSAESALLCLVTCNNNGLTSLLASLRAVRIAAVDTMKLLMLMVSLAIMLVTVATTKEPRERLPLAQNRVVDLGFAPCSLRCHVRTSSGQCVFSRSSCIG